ncbi:MAG: hypothetical protein GYA17_21840, partial [Chloroflexi bacterium]|nr:hypothetical protein [Chloroflexota bacterium]
RTPPPVSTVTLSPGLAQPTNTPAATGGAATSAVVPCNRAEFVADMTYSDNSEVSSGSSFVKIWRLKNSGSCTWTSGYQLVFDHGDQMGAPNTAQLTTVSVAPGGTVDASVSLTAPASSGTYQGNFALRAPDGTQFGIGEKADGTFWVKVVVAPAQPTVSVTPLPAADLIVTEFTLNPATPVQSQPVEVRVSVYNQGGTAAGAFSVEWWAGENFSSPGCSWNLDSMNARGGRVLTCTYAGYPSWYGSLTSKVVVDPSGSVPESDESNNVSKLVIAVSQP